MFDGLSSKRQKLWARAAPGFPSRDRSRRGRLARRQLVGAERGPRFSGRASIAISLLLSCPPRPLGLGEVLLELGPAVRGWAAGKGGGPLAPRTAQQAAAEPPATSADLRKRLCEVELWQGGGRAGAAGVCLGRSLAGLRASACCASGVWSARASLLVRDP